MGIMHKIFRILSTVIFFLKQTKIQVTKRESDEAVAESVMMYYQDYNKKNISTSFLF